MADRSDYEYEKAGYERRLAWAEEAKDKELVDQMKERIKQVRAVMGDTETAAREPGERVVAPKPQKRG
jgi:hypothetical protein